MGIKIIKNLNKIKKDSLPLVIGYFGCIHVMHQQLLTKYHHFNVLTFTDLSNKKKHQIYNYKNRLINLQKFNPKTIYVLDVTSRNMTGMKFINNVLSKIKPSEILVGEDFKFGSDNLDIKVLQNYFKVSAQRYNPNVSTEKIYHWIIDGDLEKANDYMSFYLYIQNKWIPGLKKARTLGFPTINLKNERPFIIPQGSYVTYIHIGNKKYKSVSFVGESKVVHHRESLVETYVFDAKIKPRLVYPLWVRNSIKVEFVKFIRPAQQLTSLKSLKDHISKDVLEAKKYFKEQSI